MKIKSLVFNIIVFFLLYLRTLSGMDNSREVSEIERQMAETQGLYFGNLMKKFITKETDDDDECDNSNSPVSAY